MSYTLSFMMMKDDLQLSILDYCPIGHFVIDSQYRIIFWNRCMESWTGIFRDDILGGQLYDHFPRLKKQIYSARIKITLEGGPPAVFSSQLHKYLIPAPLPGDKFRIQHSVITSFKLNRSNGQLALFAILDETGLTDALHDNRSALKKLSEEVDVRKKVEEDLIASKQHAENVTMAKSEFLANMSHELRSPLNAMLVLSKILADNGENTLTNEQVDFAEIIYSSGSDLLTLINDILDLAKVEANKIELEIDNVCLADLIGDLARKYALLAQQSDLEFIWLVADNVPALITSDYQRIYQILRNFISNSLKFTSKGSITVSVFCPDIETEFDAVDLKDGNCIAISVADTGIGIHKDKYNLIFDSFTQADGSTSRKFGGTGLGLSISREFCKLMGGEIRVESVVGEGAVFTLFIPRESLVPMLSDDKLDALVKAGVDGEVNENERREGEESRRSIEGCRRVDIVGRRTIDYLNLKKHEKAVESRHDTGPDPSDDTVQLQDYDGFFSGKSVLFVDDDMRIVFTIMSVLKKIGMNVDVAKDGKTAIGKYQSKPNIDLILMDIVMPIMDGLTAIQQIREIEKRSGNRVPIIAFTAKAMVGDREKCLAAGADDYLAKPAEINALLKMMKKNCNHSA